MGYRYELYYAGYSFDADYCETNILTEFVKIWHEMPTDDQIIKAIKDNIRDFFSSGKDRAYARENVYTAAIHADRLQIGRKVVNFVGGWDFNPNDDDPVDTTDKTFEVEYYLRITHDSRGNKKKGGE